MMDSRLSQAISNNDLQALSCCLLEYHKEGHILEQRDEESNTILHLAVQAGKTEMVAEIVRLLNHELLRAENAKQETSLQQACRQSNPEIVRLLLKSNPTLAYKLNNENQTIFSVACSHGFVEAVELMLGQPWLMEFEETAVDSIPLHFALAKGHSDLVKKVLQVRPTLAAKTNQLGSSLLHYASTLGEVKIVKMILSFDPLLAFRHNRSGHTPVHLAVICGRLEVVEEFISRTPVSFQLSTLDEGDTVFHLAAKFNQYEIFVFLSQEDYSYASKLLHRPNRSGNSALHVAVSRGNYQLAQYIMYMRNWVYGINFQNHSGQTVLDILNHVEGTPETYDLTDIIKRAGGKTSEELTTTSVQQEAIQSSTEEEAALATNSRVVEEKPAEVDKENDDSFQEDDGVLSSILDAQIQDNNNNPATEHLPARPVMATTNSRVEEIKPEEVDEENNSSSDQADELSLYELSLLKTIASSSHGYKYSSPKTNASKHRRRPKRKAQQFTNGILSGEINAQNQDNNQNPTIEHLPAEIMATNSTVEEKLEEADDENDDTSEDDEFSSILSSSPRDNYYSPKANANKPRRRLKKNAQQYLRRQSMIREKLIEMQNFRQDNHQETYKEALQNTRNTITLVAILVATVSFAAGLNPPGGVYQDGPHIGKSVAGKSTAFKVFVISNNIALFISLCIVIVLVSIVPFRRKAQMRLLVLAHRTMWVAVSFMATAYVAAAWVTVPHDHKERWVFVALISTCGGTLGTAFICLTVKLVEHKLRKSKWRKEQGEQQKRGKQAEELRAERIISLQREKETIDSKVIKITSFNSDYLSSRHLGYHSVG